MQLIKEQIFKREVVYILAAIFVSMLLIVAAYLFSGNYAYAINTCGSGWQIGSGKTINCHSYCAYVSKSGGPAFFVPTNTSDEWGSFRSNPPTAANINTGGGSCPGGGGGGGGGGGSTTTYGTRWWCECGGETNTFYTCPESVSETSVATWCYNRCQWFGGVSVRGSFCSASCNNSGC